jgi:hypothetical protein
MTLNGQLHNSATHKAGNDPACPVCRTQKIRELNDLARTAMGVCCELNQTPGIRALPPADQSAIREEVEKFCDFNPDNDPYGEHDFGSFTRNGDKIFWKIDYYDKALEYGSEHPEDPGVTTRVLTIMLADEY